MSFMCMLCTKTSLKMFYALGDTISFILYKLCRYSTKNPKCFKIYLIILNFMNKTKK